MVSPSVALGIDHLPAVLADHHQLLGIRDARKPRSFGQGCLAGAWDGDPFVAEGAFVFDSRIRWWHVVAR